MKGNVYLVVHDLTFYFNEHETAISDREIMALYQHADYIYIQNEFGHWKFIKNRSVGLDGYEYFDRKDLLNEIPLQHRFQKRESLYYCRPILNAECAHEAINLWRRRREQLYYMSE
ncbi:hypothetical protein JK38_00133 [Shigella phage JK38]|uniref:Uncharacterized protein n=1 Tax=Shigella phage JK38 TaxID=2591061 RepID=A0A5B9N176_9CAUD|nr:hypothetical protein [Escherichia coli]QEG05983.1 hypothetical protein JK38_00133 [Shigella phage JK38]